MIQSTQRFSAGFIKFFFDKTEEKEDNSLVIEFPWDEENYNDMALHLLKPELL